MTFSLSDSLARELASKLDSGSVALSARETETFWTETIFLSTFQVFMLFCLTYPHCVYVPLHSGSTLDRCFFLHHSWVLLCSGLALKRIVVLPELFFGLRKNFSNN